MKEKIDKELLMMAQKISDMVNLYSRGKQKDVVCWDLFNGEIKSEDFEYLTKVGEYTYPAKIRNVDIVRNKLNLLISQYTMRTSKISVYSTDRKSLWGKLDYKAQMHTSMLKDRVTQMSMGIDQQLNQIQEQIQSYEYQLSVEPENEEMAQKIEQLKAMQPQIMMQFGFLKQKLESQKLMTEEDQETIDYTMRFKYRDLKEMHSVRIMNYCKAKLNINYESIEALKEKVVTGKQYYFVDYTPGNSLPEFKKLDGIKVFYPNDGGNRWVQDGDWCVIEEMLSLSEVIQEFGSKLNFVEKQSLESYGGGVDENFVSLPDYGAVEADTGVYSGTRTTGRNIKVRRMWWRQSTTGVFSRTPNPHREGKTFLNYVKPEHYARKGKKGSSRETRYIDHIYQAVIIADTINVDFRLKPIQIRKVDNMSKPPLPIVGKAYNSLSDRPYSYVWATKDIQALYNIINYQQELLIALSGVKGFIMDHSQKPDSMDENEWLYHKKQGVAWIETVKKGRRVNSSFNQFQTYDDTVGQGVASLEAIKTSLENAVYSITGVSRARMGEVVNTDQVGTYAMSQENSSLLTEVIYWEHEEVICKAYSQLISICNKVVWPEGTILEFTTPEEGNEVFRIPKDIDKGDYEAIIQNNGKTERDLREIKSMASNYFAKNQSSFSNIVSIYRTDSVIELQKKVDQIEDDARKYASQGEEAQKQNEIEMKQQISEIELKYNQALNQNSDKIKELEIMLKERDTDIKDRAQQLKEAIEPLKLQLDLEKVKAENVTENNYLNEQIRSNMTSEMLQATQLKIDSIISGETLKKDERDSVRKHSVDIKKANSTSGKEHISDR